MRNASTVSIFAFLVVVAGCQAHFRGIVESGPGGRTSLVTYQGKTFRLMTLGESAPLGKLNGYMVEVWGHKVLRSIRVGDWKAPTGIHGMTAWVGVLKLHGVQIALDDRNTGGFYFIHRSCEDEMRPLVGHTVVIEGYVEGDHRVQVMDWEVLD